MKPFSVRIVGGGKTARRFGPFLQRELDESRVARVARLEQLPDERVDVLVLGDGIQTDSAMRELLERDNVPRVVLWETSSGLDLAALWTRWDAAGVGGPALGLAAPLRSYDVDVILANHQGSNGG